MIPASIYKPGHILSKWHFFHIIAIKIHFSNSKWFGTIYLNFCQLSGCLAISHISQHMFDVSYFSRVFFSFKIILLFNIIDFFFKIKTFNDKNNVHVCIGSQVCNFAFKVNLSRWVKEKMLIKAKACPLGTCKFRQRPENANLSNQF